MSSPPPTLDQMLNLIERAERKAGLTTIEAQRLRDGLRQLTSTALEATELRQRNFNLSRSVETWKGKATAATTAEAALVKLLPAPAPAAPAPPPSAPPPEPVDEPPLTDDAAAIRRVTTLAQRWAYIPAKRAAAAAILAAIKNRDRSA
ncbi:hypothetical protein ABZ619_39105 [Streptomyces sp. NPDC007851]|uniref:hypothetical protein n=1 Tax=Streptomyces sp. NPDC007851 TaxID=3155008 RepID=UPI0033C7ED97